MTLRSLFPSVRVLLAALSLAAGLIAYTGQAHASRTQESIFQDDRLLQNRKGPGARAGRGRGEGAGGRLRHRENTRPRRSLARGGR